MMLKKAKEAENIWSRIVFTGKVEKKTLNDFYQMADVGIVSSIHEEFGYVAVEMMMHDLPVIAGDAGGLSEIIEDGLSGLTVPVITRKKDRSLNVSQLSKKGSLLLENSDLALQIGERGRQRFLQRYELSVFKEKMKSLYNSL